MNTFYIQLDRNGRPIGWLLPIQSVEFPTEIDFIKEFTGHYIPQSIWSTFKLDREVIKRISTKRSV